MITVDLYQIFCANVRSLMSYHKMTQADLSRALGVSEQHISQLLNGRRRPGLSTIEGVSKALGVEPHRLLEKIPEKIAG